MHQSSSDMCWATALLCGQPKKAHGFQVLQTCSLLMVCALTEQVFFNSVLLAPIVKRPGSSHTQHRCLRIVPAGIHKRKLRRIRVGTSNSAYEPQKAEDIHRVAGTEGQGANTHVDQRQQCRHGI